MNGVLAAVVCIVAPVVALAQDIVVQDAFIPQAPPGAMVHAAYMALANTGDRTASLIAVSASDYAMAHLHQSRDTDGIATMTQVQQLDIAPGQTITLTPGGLHVMLMRPKAPMTPGQDVPLDLHFTEGHTLSVTATITPRAPSS